MASAANVAPVVAAPRLLDKLAIGPVGVGLYVALVYIGAMLAGQAGGALVRRWGPIRTSQVALVLCIAGLLLVSVPYPLTAVLGALCLGFGYGPITPASSDMLARVTPPEKFAMVFSLKQTGVPLGGAFAGLLVPVVLELAGIQWAMLQVAGLCVLGVVLAQTLRPALDDLRDKASPFPTLASVVLPLRFVLVHPVLRPLALCSCVFSIVQLSLCSYLVTFLHGDLRWGLIAAGLALSATQVAGIVGRVLWGMVADRARAPRQTLLGLAAAMMVSGLLVPLLRIDTAHERVVLMMALYGATAIGWNGVFLATVARMVPRKQVAMATGGCLFFTYLGVVVGPLIFGLFGSWFGSLAYSYALLALPLAWVIWKLSRSRWDGGSHHHTDKKVA